MAIIVRVINFSTIVIGIKSVFLDSNCWARRSVQLNFCLFGFSNCSPRMTIQTSQSYFCCSQHPSTVDWGASTRCDSSILEVLFLRFEAACARSTKDRKQQPSEQNSCINATPKFLPCMNKGGNQIPKYDGDCADDDDSIVPLLGSTHFGFVKEHYQIS